MTFAYLVVIDSVIFRRGFYSGAAIIIIIIIIITIYLYYYYYPPNKAWKSWCLTNDDDNFVATTVL